MADREGQRLGNYQLSRMLGEGGFAEVYLGEHIYLYTQAAIKVLHTQLTSEDVEKFSVEARNLARLIHPHIVRVLDFGVEGKTPYLVMDYAPNGTLRKRHNRGTPLALPVIVGYVKQVADALQFAHNQKLIHRDVKPENMLLGRNNELLLSDFGIALIAQSSRYQNTQDMAGTIAYMAPEQIQAHPRPASDQYSLGIVVYEWLTGDIPFQGSFTEIAIKHSIVPPPPLREKVPTISSDVEQVVLTALAKDPKERFRTVQAFATALEQAGTPTMIDSHIPLIPPSPETKRSPEIVSSPGFSNTSAPAPSPTPGPAVPVPSLPSPILPPQSALSDQGNTGLYRQRLPETADQRIGPEYTSRTQKSPNLAMIIGIPLLLLVLVGGSILLYTHGIFPFSNTSSGGINNSNNNSNSGGSTGAIVNGRGCKKIGVLLPETATSARWENNDKPALQADIPAQLPGATVDYNNAQGSADTQQTQAQAMLTNGDCILVLAPVDAIKAASIVSAAKAKAVPVISYDRLIYSNDTNYFVSFDGVAVGKLQGQYIADHYQSYVAANGTNNTVMINGAQTDNNALLFSAGAHQALDPLFTSGALKKVYEQFTPGWNNATAQTEMEAALTANGNKIAIAYVANDGMANNVIAALKAVKLNGKVLVTGQDATVAGLQNILKGDQAMTVYKAIPKEAMATAQLVAALSNGTDTSSLINGQSVTVPITGGAAIPSILVTPVAVDKTNIQSTVIADNFVTISDICAGLPSGTGGICP
jgi:D-xylose transport system substrate-binding protein